jgi:hypothetical protein
MSWHYLEKEFYDYADNIEGVNIHYLWTSLGGVADWERQRETRFMPLVQSSRVDVHAPLVASGSSVAPQARLRKKILKLPLHIVDPDTGAFTSRYLLYHYFEVFQDGHRYYSPLYTEEISTGGTLLDTHEKEETSTSSLAPLPHAYASMKESKE